MQNIEDLNIFMMCPQLNRGALTELPKGFYVRNCTPEDLDFWMAMHFDNPEDAVAYRSFMQSFFRDCYGGKEDLFFANTLMVCNKKEEVVGTCGLWKAYGQFNSIHWFKVIKSYEGQGIGRALLSEIMKDLPSSIFPIYLHTQAGSYRAIKLYADFGFSIIKGAIGGPRENEIDAALPYLSQQMPAKDFRNLKFQAAPVDFLDILEASTTIEF